MNNSYFITGTDTHIGKTEITCALINFFKRKGLLAMGMKPVAAGTEIIDNQLINSDVYKFLLINSIKKSVKIINPYCFDQAIAPHIASNLTSNEILFSKIKENLLLLQKECEYLFVEGAGGYKVPLAKNKSVQDLISYLNTPIILVVGIRLGCINHTMLTVESIKNNNHNLTGWVANCIDPNMNEVDENIKYLVNNIEAPFMGKIPFQKKINTSKIADYLLWPGTL
ncbi:dethiobiotin synthase [Methylophilaceae bacterium]|jgi:dethiobiotin synthetase|nr:dethiobiotin synthase [Methylophilaceae bacterium]